MFYANMVMDILCNMIVGQLTKIADYIKWFYMIKCYLPNGETVDGDGSLFSS